MDEFFSPIHDSNNPPTYFAHIAGTWKVSESGKTKEITNPVDLSVIGKIQIVTQGEIDAAIAKAKLAQKEWVKIPMIKRSQILHLAADLIRQHEAHLTDLLMREIAKTKAEAKDEILRSADMVEYFANEGLDIKGEELSGEAFPGYDATKMAIIERVPVGVILAIAPFNYPVNLSVSKLAPALIMGNAVIYKPPTVGSLSALHLTHLFHKAGITPGLLSAVTGGGETIGDYLVTHPGINMITFTGSSDVGKHIGEKAGMIALQTECGGNNPAIVLPDADLAFTAGEIVKGAFSYSGQRCTAIKYVLGLNPTIDALLPLVTQQTKKTIKTGDPHTEGVTMGPVYSEAAADDIEKRILETRAKGGKLVMGGTRNGRIIEPTIFDDLKPGMPTIATETFGPVVGFIRVNSIDEAVKIINESKYGLQACIFTNDEGAGIALGKQIDVGTVQINSKPQRGPDHFPFLGVKASGVGVQGIRYSLESMTRFRPIVLNKPH